MGKEFYSEFEFQSSLNMDECGLNLKTRRGKNKEKLNELIVGMVDDILSEDSYEEHKVIGSKKLAWTKELMADYIPMDDNNLIHQSTHALWRISEDGSYIEAIVDEEGGE